MPRYFFDVRNNSGFTRDEAGEEFVNFEEARAQAQALLPDIVREELPDGELHQISCDVRDDAGTLVYRGELTFRGTLFKTN